MASDKNFVLFRRFAELHARILLYKQDELVEMEQRLNNLDAEEQTPYHLASRRDDSNLSRKALVSEIESKLSAYDKALETYYRQMERPGPKERNIKNVARWLDGNKPLALPESSFMNNWDDLVAPSDALDHGGLDAVVANVGALLHRWRMPMVFTNRVDANKTADGHIIMFTASRIAQVSRCLTTLLAVIFLSTPITVLYNTTAMSSRLWVITLFTAGFSSILSLFTRSRNYEIFSATAA